MSEELQSLLDKINSDGIRKAETESNRITSEAESKAEAIIAKAKAEAENIKTQAEADAESFRQRAISAAGQAARDIALQLRTDLQKRLEDSVNAAAARAFAPEFMASLIKELAAKFAESPDARITVRCAAKDVDALNKALQAALADSFTQAPVLFASAGLNGGFEVDFKDGKCFFDFSADAVAELMKNYIGEQLAVIFKAE